MCPGEQTAHEKLKIPIPADEDTMLKMSKSSKSFSELEDLALPVFDEKSMVPKHMLETIDRSICLPVRICIKPFHGKCIILADDFG